MKPTVITRRSRIGAAWRTITPEDDGPSPKPDYIGSPKTVLAALNNDRNLRAIASGGVFYRVDFFIKVEGKWKRYKMHDEFERENQLYSKYRDSYLHDELRIDIIDD